LQIQSLRNNNLSIFKKHFSSFFIFFTFRFYSQDFIFFKISFQCRLQFLPVIQLMKCLLLFGVSFVISILICFKSKSGIKKKQKNAAA
jgi:hypothetical protein